MFSKNRVTNVIRHIHSTFVLSRYDHYLAQSTKQNNEDSKISGDLNEEIKSQILYSSIIEKEKVKLGFHRNKIYQDIKEKFKYKEKIEKMKEKPFSAALKYFTNDNRDINKNIYSKRKLESETLEEKNQSTTTHFPKSWLTDYEFYDDNEEEIEYSQYGTNDFNIPPSNVPCNGCGAKLHCCDPGIAGYIPCEIFKGRTDNELKRIICQRCHFLKHYNIALDIIVKPEEYIETLSTIKDKFALAVLIVDLLDFPCSIWPQITEIIGKKRPVILVGNKVDLLPKDSPGYLDVIKKSLKDAALDFGLNKLNIKQVCLISAKTGYGIEELVTQLHKIWKYQGDVYLIGCANVGKSSLFNALLSSDYCKVEATDLVRKATTCPWPGTTLKMLKFPILRPSDIRIYERFQRILSQKCQKTAEEKLRKDQLKATGKIKYATLTGHIGMTFKNPKETNDPFSTSQGANPILTLDENSKYYIKSKWCYDTPGVINPEQIHNLLTTEELILMNPIEMISPRAFRLSKDMSLFLAGLGRIDFLDCDLKFVKLYVFASKNLPILITETSNAECIYESLLGSKYLSVPFGNNERLQKWPKLVSTEVNVEGLEEDIATCDMLLSSAGWISMHIPYSQTCKFLVWTPHKRGIFVRKPALVRYPDNLCGTKIRKSLAYREGKPFIRK